jgi:dipeptidyl aminopeptidase/acylaminoacyl peptidase
VTWRPWIAAVATGAIACSAPSGAGAAFPGRNGRIAFDNVAMLSVRPSGGLRVLGRGYHPKYSWSGRMVAYGCGSDEVDQCRRGVGIRIRRADGRGRPRALTRDNWDNYPDWSPGGHRVVFSRYRSRSLLEPELWIYHRGHSRRLTQGEEPAWSIKGEIAFVRPRTTGGEPSDLYVIRPDGSHLRHLGGGFDPEWSPDGRELVYASNGCGYSCLYTIRRDGRG